MNKERNYGIDVLRIVAMMMIVSLHILNKGGVLWEVNRGSLRYMAVWFWETATFCSVNVYAMISGYVGIQRKTRLSRVLLLWLQVLFYTVVITFLWTLKNPEYGTWAVWKGAIFPIVTKQYWYMSAYFGMSLLLPCLHWILDKISEKEAKLMGIILFIIFSIIPSLFQADPFMLQKGNSVLWLCILYIIGGCIKKFEFFKKWTKKRLLALYFAMIIFSWGSKLIIERVVPRSGDARYDMMFIEYTAPTMLIAAASLVILFSKIQIKSGIGTKFVEIIASATLGVYIIHEQRFIKNNFITGISKNCAYAKNTIYMIFEIGIIILLVYSICTVIEWTRIKIFNSIHIEEKCRLLDEKIKSLYMNKKKQYNYFKCRKEYDVLMHHKESNEKL